MHVFLTCSYLLRLLAGIWLTYRTYCVFKFELSKCFLILCTCNLLIVIYFSLYCSHIVLHPLGVLILNIYFYIDLTLYDFNSHKIGAMNVNICKWFFQTTVFNIRGYTFSKWAKENRKDIDVMYYIIPAETLFDFITHSSKENAKSKWLNSVCDNR